MAATSKQTAFPTFRQTTKLEKYYLQCEWLIEDYQEILNAKSIKSKGFCLKPFAFKTIYLVLHGPGYPQNSYKIDLHHDNIEFYTLLANISIFDPNTTKMAINQFVIKATRGTNFSSIAPIRVEDLKKWGIQKNLTIRCEITHTHLSTSDVVVQEIKSIPSVIDLLMYENGIKCTDFTFKCNGKDIKVHKSILAQKSSVFETMFKQEMCENTGETEIEDIDHETFLEMIRYLYTGRIENMENLACNLLYSADKYDISSLKLLCENYLAAEITVENVVDTFVTASMNQAKMLKDHALTFIIKNLAAVTKTKSYQTLPIQNCDILKEIMQSCANFHI